MPVLILGVSLYIWIALVSFLFLIIVAIMGQAGLDFGGDADVDLDYGEFSGPGVSPLSPTFITIFGATFGSFGALLETSGFGTITVAAGAALVGVAIAGGMFLLVERVLVRSQTSSDVRTEELVGRTAQVSIPIAPGSQGQILVMTEERGRSLFPAVSDSALARDAMVEITGFSGGVANVRKKLE